MKKNEYGNTSNLLKNVLSVSHAEIKAKLGRERAARKRKKTKKSSASREAV